MQCKLLMLWLLILLVPHFHRSSAPCSLKSNWFSFFSCNSQIHFCPGSFALAVSSFVLFFWLFILLASLHHLMMPFCTLYPRQLLIHTSLSTLSFCLIFFMTLIINWNYLASLILHLFVFHLSQSPTEISALWSASLPVLFISPGT